MNLSLQEGKRGSVLGEHEWMMDFVDYLRACFEIITPRNRGTQIKMFFPFTFGLSLTWNIMLCFSPSNLTGSKKIISFCVGCSHFTTVGIQVSFIAPNVSFLLCPSSHHSNLPPHPQTSLIKKQQFLVIKAVGYQDKIRPSFYQIALWVGRKEQRERGSGGGMPPAIRDV